MAPGWEGETTTDNSAKEPLAAKLLSLRARLGTEERETLDRLVIAALRAADTPSLLDAGDVDLFAIPPPPSPLPIPYPNVAAAYHAAVSVAASLRWIRETPPLEG